MDHPVGRRGRTAEALGVLEPTAYDPDTARRERGGRPVVVGETAHLVAGREQLVDDPDADVAGGPRDKDLHERLLSRGVP